MHVNLPLTAMIPSNHTHFLSYDTIQRQIFLYIYNFIDLFSNTTHYLVLLCKCSLSYVVVHFFRHVYAYSLGYVAVFAFMLTFRSR